MFRPPRQYSANLPQDPLAAALDQEIIGEKAATLGRLLKQLDKALADLANFEAEQCLKAADTSLPDTLIDTAGEALWHVVIQRELCGFTRTEQFLRDKNVPKSVRLRMGIARASKPIGGRRTIHACLIIFGLVALSMAPLTNPAAADDWRAFREKVVGACLQAIGGRMSNVNVAVDRTGSRRFGLVLLSGTYKGQQSNRICVYDKRTGQTELGGNLEVVPK